MSDPEEAARLFAQGAWSAPAAWEAPPPESLEIPGVDIVGFVGRGGMGAIYQGVQSSLGRTVAVKLLPPQLVPNLIARERFVREARILAELDHPHILHIIDFGELETGGLYLVMEWAPGGDLAARLRTSQPDTEEMLRWIQEIASGLDFAHQNGIVHRDFKPGNVLLDREGRLKLGDFGLAKAVGNGFTTELTLSGTTFGTLDYMAPEQFDNGAAVTPKSDIYALGVLTYQLFTKRLPKGVFVPASSLAGVPKKVDEVLRKALSANPNERFDTAGDFSRALNRAMLPSSSTRRILIRVGTFLVLGGGVLLGPRLFREETEPTLSAQATPAPATPAPATPAPAPTSSPAWLSLLPRLDLARQTRAGTWVRVQEGIQSGNGRSILQFPVEVGESYDFRIRFTRISGRHSIAVFLPTGNGNGTWELDAWEQGIGGLQDINGRDLRSNGTSFPARLENGNPQEVIIKVRPGKVAFQWGESPEVTLPLAGRQLSINPLWQTEPPALPGIGSWESPTVFESVEFRRVPP